MSMGVLRCTDDMVIAFLRGSAQKTDEECVIRAPALFSRISKVPSVTVSTEVYQGVIGVVGDRSKYIGCD